MAEYALSDCGIDELGTIEIEVDLLKVRIVAGAPISFFSTSITPRSSASLKTSRSRRC